MGQIVKVTGISGNTITLDRPLYFTFLSSLSPAILPFNIFFEDAGVESLTILRNDDWRATGHRAGSFRRLLGMLGEER